MSYQNFLDEVKRGLPLKIYLIISSDHFLQTEALSFIKKLVLPEERDFNFHSFDLLNTDNNKVPFDHILDVLKTVPFVSGRKFIVIENVQKLVKKDLTKLEQYILKPSDSSVLILLNAGPLKKDFKDNIKKIKQIQLDIREKEIPSWLKEKARSKGFEISDSAANYLLGTIGPDIGMLSSELEKILLIGKSTIEKNDIIEIIEGKRTYNAFSLIDAIRAKDTERVFKIYSVLKDTEEPYSLLGALNWQYGQFMLNKISQKDRNYYYKVFSLLNKADIDIKSSGSFYPVELLLVKLLRIPKQV